MNIDKKAVGDKIKNKVIEKIESYIPVDKTIDARLTILGKTYEIYTFETEFQQEIDHKQQPQHEVKGGLLSFSISQAPDDLLNMWMFKPGIFYDGIITFAPVSRTSSPPIVITFVQGKCIFYQKIIAANMGMHLKMIVSSKQISVNGIEHKNNPKFTLV